MITKTNTLAGLIKFLNFNFNNILLNELLKKFGQVAELLYALVLGTSAARLKSSSLFLPTKNIMKIEKQSKKGLKTTLNILVNKSDIKKKWTKD